MEWAGEEKAIRLTITAFGWVRKHEWAGVDITPFPKVAAWLKRIESRPGANAGLGVPERKASILSKEEEEKLAKENSAWIIAGTTKE